MEENRVTGMFNISHPIFLGGMAGVTDAYLAAAVSNAGGLGTIAGFKATADELRAEIKKIKEMTTLPFAVNIPLVVAQVQDLIDTVLDTGVPVAITAAGNPAVYTKRLKDAGIKVVHVVSCSDLAKRAEDAGVDAVIAEGFESGGFGSPFEIGTLALVPQVVDSVKIPVLAAGGISDARGYAACFILGAEGASIGTAFMLTEEARLVGTAWKKALMKAGDTSTRIMARGIAPFRAMVNTASEEIQQRLEKGATRKDIIREITSADWAGDKETLFTCGQAVGLLKEVRTVKQVIDDLVAGANRLLSSR